MACGKPQGGREVRHLIEPQIHYARTSDGDVVTASTMVPRLPVVADHLREMLGAAVFDELAREGAAMDRSQAVAYAHAEIQRAREELRG